MFLGHYEHSIDEKGRLIIPARFRELLAEGAYVTRGFERNLIVMTTSSFHRLAQSVTGLNFADQDARVLRRLIFADAAQVEFDRAGRFLLPGYLRQAAEIEGPVVIVGVGSHFEIWAEDKWAEQTEELNNIETTTKRFAALNFSVQS